MCEILRKFDISSLYTCPPYLYTVTTLPWEIQKVIFQQYYSYRLQIIMLSQKKQTFNCCTAAYLTYCCLLLSIICVALFYCQFVYLFGQSFSKPPMPTHNRLFSESPTFGGTQHYLQSGKSFTLYKVVWWHFSAVVGKGVTVCFFSEITNNLKYVWIIPLKMTFWVSQGKVATVYR